MTEYLYNLGLAFEAIVDRHPENVALRHAESGDMSYRTLDGLANSIARTMQASGVGCGNVVAILNAKTPSGYAAMLACLKLGAIYVNLDDQNPLPRLAAIVENCRPQLLAADMPLRSDLAAHLAETGVPTLRLDNTDLLSAHGAARLDGTRRVLASSPAYLMFTSGSTGVPKGAVISHFSVLNFIAWSRSEFEISPQDVLTNVNPIYFDNSVFDFYSALFSGAALASIPRTVLQRPDALVALVESMRCSIWFSVPSLLIYLMAMKQLSPASWPSMRCVVFGGEGYPRGELRKLNDLLATRARLVNVYGPTECTCICSAHTIVGDDLIESSGLPPLGRLAANFQRLILDEDGVPVAAGAVGQLCLLGPQVGLGYFNDAERTDASFVQNPLHSAYLDRMYRTGDLVREDGAGCLWFVGRCDNQIKHMGYRIELEEIEAALAGLSYVVQACAVYQRLREQHGRIVAYLVSADAPAESVIRDDLRRSLPDYMLPARLLVLAELPKNANGKVDRKALLTMLSSGQI